MSFAPYCQWEYRAQEGQRLTTQTLKREWKRLTGFKEIYNGTRKHYTASCYEYANRIF